MWPTYWNATSSNYNISSVVDGTTDLVALLLEVLSNPPHMDSQLTNLLNFTTLMDIFDRVIQQQIQQK